MFDFPEGAYSYRPLRKRRKRQTGWDVFALQTAIAGLGFDLDEDGIFGPATKKAVERYQRQSGLYEDGIAGVITQRSLALKYARQLRGDLPGGLLKGQIEHESSFWLGNHTAPYPNGERDCGVCQRNSTYTPALEAFHVPGSIAALAQRVSEKHELYLGWGVVQGKRAWELAAGSWNAPSWTDRLAKGAILPDAHSAHIERYIEDVTAYARL